MIIFGEEDPEIWSRKKNQYCVLSRKSYAEDPEKDECLSEEYLAKCLMPEFWSNRKQILVLSETTTIIYFVACFKSKKLASLVLTTRPNFWVFLADKNLLHESTRIH